VETEWSDGRMEYWKDECGGWRNTRLQIPRIKEASRINIKS
jgi:hypothetical protein